MAFQPKTVNVSEKLRWCAQAGRPGSQGDGTSYAASAFSLEDFPSQHSQADAASQADSDAGFLSYAAGAYQTQNGFATQQVGRLLLHKLARRLLTRACLNMSFIRSVCSPTGLTRAHSLACLTHVCCVQPNGATQNTQSSQQGYL